MKQPTYDFFLQTGRVLNSQESSTILLTGNTNDHFYAPKLQKYVPLNDFLKSSMKLSSNMIVTYQMTKGIQFQNPKELAGFTDSWSKWRSETSVNSNFVELYKKANQNVTYALELLRQMCLCSSAMGKNSKAFFSKKLLIIMDGVSALLPPTNISHLNESEHARVEICTEWFKDPQFLESEDAVILISESKNQISPLITKLPHILEIQVLSPDEKGRQHFLEWYNKNQSASKKLKLSTNKRELLKTTAGLSILSLRRLFKSISHTKSGYNPELITLEVKRFMESELGDIVKFIYPSHNLSHVMGCRKLKTYIKKHVIPRFKSTKSDCLPGATVCGPIGGGKTFFWEAVANESGMIVLVLRQLRDKYFGESDIRLEKLRRTLYSFSNVLVFIDEADAQFTSLSSGQQHETEKRLQAGLLTMMSDPQLRGKVKWLLLTARIDNLSPDMLRPGRPGSLVIPMLDPQDKDREDFIYWAVKPVLRDPISQKTMNDLLKQTEGYFASMYAELRAELLHESKGKKLTLKQIKSVINDIIKPAISKTREHQSLTAKIYCNRRSLLPDNENREDWLMALRELKME